MTLRVVQLAQTGRIAEGHAGGASNHDIEGGEGPEHGSVSGREHPDADESEDVNGTEQDSQAEDATLGAPGQGLTRGRSGLGVVGRELVLRRCGHAGGLARALLGSGDSPRKDRS